MLSVIYNYITAKMWNVTRYFNTLGWNLLSVISRVIPFIRFMLVERVSKLGFYLGLKRSISRFKTCMQSNQGLYSLDRLVFVRVTLICTAPCQIFIFIKLLGIRKKGWRIHQLLDWWNKLLPPTNQTESNQIIIRVGFAVRKSGLCSATTPSW